MSNFHLTEALVRLQLADRYDEASYIRSVRRATHRTSRRRHRSAANTVDDEVRFTPAVRPFH